MTKILKKITFILLFLFVLTLSCPDGCYQCDQNNCLACSDGYERTAEGNCIKPSIENCVLFGNPTTCYKCKPTFRLVNNQCVKLYSGCVRFGTSNKCMQCGFGMQLGNDTCVGVLNCLTVGKSCTQCKQGYKLQNNICKSTITNCTQTDQQSGACKKCQQNNILSGYQCVADFIDPEFCYVYDTNGKCIYCKEGFTNLEGVCYTSGEMQKLFNGDNVRARRMFKEATGSNNNGSSQSNVNNNQGAKNISQTTQSFQQQSSSPSTQQLKPLNPIDKCARYDTTLTQCLMCDTNYILVNQSCFYSIQGCLSYQQQTKTTVICKKCLQQYDLQPKTNICLIKQLQEVKDCFIPAANKLSCIVCNQGFTLTNGQCFNNNSNSLSTKNDSNFTVEKRNCASFDQSNKKCKSCVSNNFRLQNDICYDNNCMKFNSNDINKCDQCKPFFVLNQAKSICEYKDTNCQLALQQRCSQCTKNYFITNDGYCAPMPYGCQIPNTKTVLCSICQSGFVLLANSTCRQQLVIENCQLLQTNTNAINKCAICIDGFYPSFDTCKRVSSRCNGYDKDTGACFACSGIFLFNKGKCLDPNCVKQSLNEVDKCDKCKDGYVFKNGICRFDDSNCLVVLNDTCKQCVEGYQFSVQKNTCVLASSTNNSQSTSSQTQSSTSSTTTTTPTTTTTNNKIQNCVFQNPMNPKVCLQCQKSYKLTSDLSQCIRSVSNSPSTISVSNNSTQNSSSQSSSSSLSPSQSTIIVQRDPNCQSYSNTNRCQKCVQRFYLNLNTNKCIEVNNLCSTFDQTNGNCLSCFDGFYLENAKCFLKVQIDSYCVQKGPLGCVQCVGGYFVDQSKGNTCQKMNLLCLTWNYQTGKCTGCKQGYSLIQGECLNIGNDPYCLEFQSSDKRTCKTCQDLYFLNTMTMKCQGINDNCKTYNKQTGECYTCKQGYKLTKGLCQSSLSMENFIKDYYCKTIQKNVCVQCYNGYYLSLDNVCKQKNPLCKEISRKNGDCTQCYAGYFLTQGACIIPSNIQVNSMTFNKNCKNFTNEKVDSCQQCYPGFRLVKGICLEVNPLCKGFDQKSGLCTDCYDGYYLEGGNCLVNMGNNPNELDPYCTELSKDFTNCVTCAPGYFVGDDGFCQAYNSSYQCEIFNPQNGKCISCPYSYVLSKQKICIPQIQNCNQYNSQTKCVQCSTGFYLKETLCFPQDIKCQSYDAKSGQCNKCIGGYFLVNNECIFPTFGFDKFCSKYVNSYCTECSVGSYLFNYRCREIDSNCSKFDYQVKRCLQCKNGLKVKGISCVSEI